MFDFKLLVPYLEILWVLSQILFFTVLSFQKVLDLLFFWGGRGRAQLFPRKLLQVSPGTLNLVMTMCMAASPGSGKPLGKFYF